MKKLILLFALGMTLCANAQLTVVESGQTRIGEIPDLFSSGTIQSTQYLSNTDIVPRTVDKTASLNIWGISNPSTISNIGTNMGHITFGYGNYANIAGNSASGILRLHARNRLAIVLGTSDTDGLTWSHTDKAITSTYNM